MTSDRPLLPEGITAKDLNSDKSIEKAFKAVTEDAMSKTGFQANPTISWNGTPLTLAGSLVSTNSSYCYSNIYYLYNPPSGTYNLTVSGSGRTFALDAFTLSGVCRPFSR